MERSLPKKTPDPFVVRRLLTADRLILAGLLLCMLIVRGGVLWAIRGNLQQDPDAYREIAENLLRYGEFALGKPSPDDGVSKPIPTAYRPPLYPVVLSNLPAADGQHVSLAKVATLHLALGVATAWLTWLTARRTLQSFAGPEARQEIAPPVRAGINGGKKDIERSEGPTQGNVETGVDPPGLEVAMCESPSPALRPGLLLAGPPGLDIAAIVAGLLVACDPILLNQQALVMTETLATFLAILALWCLARFDSARSWFNAGLAGGAIGLAVLCRPTFLPWLALVALAMLLVRGRNSEFRTQNSERHWLTDFGGRVASFVGLLIAAAAVMSPWAIRNYRVFGEPIVTTTHGGYTLLLGNNISFYGHLRYPMTSLPWTPHSLFWLGGTDDPFEAPPDFEELNADKYRYKVAWRTIMANRLRFMHACAYRLWQLWSPLPHKLSVDESMGRRLLRYATCAWYCGVYALAVVGVWRLRWRLVQPPWLWGLLLCLAFTAVHTFYWTNLRMRAPLMPFVAIVAAAAIHTSPKRKRG